MPVDSQYEEIAIYVYIKRALLYTRLLLYFLLTNSIQKNRFLMNDINSVQH